MSDIVSSHFKTLLDRIAGMSDAERAGMRGEMATHYREARGRVVDGPGFHLIDYSLGLKSVMQCHLERSDACQVELKETLDVIDKGKVVEAMQAAGYSRKLPWEA